jgi:hypothetical protein
MSSNRELLENAAKAAGIKGVYVSWCYNGFKEGIREPSDKSSIPWNPLTDDGPALRLAVKLNFEFDIGRNYVSVVDWNGNKTSIDSNIDSNIYAATRRAIVLAAAEIGKNAAA